MHRIGGDGFFDTITSVDNLLSAWKEFLRGKRNKKDVQEFGYHLAENMRMLRTELVSGAYRHGGYEHFRVNDPKPRDIHKASVRDRLVHHAICRVLYPFLDRTFIHDSYSCRLGKGTHRAMDTLRKYAYRASENHTKTLWVLQCDIRKFFASIDHAVLRAILARRIPGERTLALLNEVIGSFETPGRPGVGLPLGNLTSQLLVNIYLNEFDQFAKHELKARFYIRYADDVAIFSDSYQMLSALIPRVRDFLRDRLRLDLHPGKVSIRSYASGVDFLGWIHFPNCRVLRTSTKRRMLKALRGNPSEETIMSYRGMLKHGNAHKLSKLLPARLCKKTRER